MSKFRFGDLVSRRDGGLGVVVWSGSNRAIITWQDDHGNPIEHYAGGSLDGITLAAAQTPPPNTVPVRTATTRWFIAVAAGEDGSWITAHVPLPEQPAQVEGRVDG